MSSGGFCESFKMFSKVAVLVLGSLSLIPLATSTGDLSEFIGRMDEDFYNCCASNQSATSGDPLVSFGALHTYGAQQFLIVLLLIPFTFALLVATWRSKSDEGLLKTQKNEYEDNFLLNFQDHQKFYQLQYLKAL